MLAVAGDETASEDGGERGIKVAVSTLNTSDSAVMATRPQDGEKPVQPLNIHIGPSKLTLFGYAQTQSLAHSRLSTCMNTMLNMRSCPNSSYA